MKATIAIPTYNRTAYLEGVLECATQQSFDDYEVLIGDSSCNDNVLRAFTPYFDDTRVRYLRFPASTTLLSKFNALLKNAVGEWLVFLCDDDLLDHDYLSVLMERVINEPLATLVRCRFKIIDEHGNLLRLDPISKEVMRPAEFLSNLFLPETSFFKMNVSGILFHRKTFLNEGGFQEFPGVGHSDLLAWAILGSQGLSLFEKRALAQIRVHRNSQTSSNDENIQAAIETNLGVSDCIRRLLKRLEEEVSTPEDREFLRSAETNFESYMKRHLSRVFDRGFMAVLSNNRPDLKKALEAMFEMMKKMEVPGFRSAWIYPWLGHLSYAVRKPVLDAFRHYKTQKWCR